MSLFDHLSSKWENEPVEIAELDQLLSEIENLWKKNIEILGPCLAKVPNGNAGFGELSFAFGSLVGLRGQTALYRAHLDNLTVMPKDQTNNLVFSAIKAGLHDQGRSRGLLTEKLNAVEALFAGSDEEIHRAAQLVFQNALEGGMLTILFREGLEKLWKQFFMPESLV